MRLEIINICSSNSRVQLLELHSTYERSRLSSVHCRVVVVQRAELHNAFDENLIGEITAAFRAVDGDKTRAVVLTGAGLALSL